MAQAGDNTLEQLIKIMAKEELANLPSETRGVAKTAKEVAAIIMPGIVNIISVVVPAAVSATVKDVADLQHVGVTVPDWCSGQQHSDILYSSLSVRDSLYKVEIW
ncbi:hypothetical protein Pcinc_000949 [Petrolisthes cinctipes]|uniref:Uncharacterized protein n=2 Tax=Petrolisthes cinctipes TaxID=88211 RepID=A0AAE1L4E5_PETCI|nr:hypothetical protein Pcinc_000949 [Petrolisthes cinctipes]